MSWRGRDHALAPRDPLPHSAALLPHHTWGWQAWEDACEQQVQSETRRRFVRLLPSLAPPLWYRAGYMLRAVPLSLLPPFAVASPPSPPPSASASPLLTRTHAAGPEGLRHLRREHSVWTTARLIAAAAAAASPGGPPRLFPSCRGTSPDQAADKAVRTRPLACLTTSLRRTHTPITTDHSPPLHPHPYRHEWCSGGRF